MKDKSYTRQCFPSGETVHFNPLPAANRSLLPLVLTGFPQCWQIICELADMTCFPVGEFRHLKPGPVANKPCEPDCFTSFPQCLQKGMITLTSGTELRVIIQFLQTMDAIYLHLFLLPKNLF
jgi:hypothetical protein